MDTVLGQLRAEIAQPRDPDRIYRLTSPVYWVGLARDVVRWLLRTRVGKVVTIIGALLLAFASGVMNRLGQMVVDQFSSR